MYINKSPRRIDKNAGGSNKKIKNKYYPKIDISTLIAFESQYIVPPDLTPKPDPDLKKGLGSFQKQFRFDE